MDILQAPSKEAPDLQKTGGGSGASKEKAGTYPRFLLVKRVGDGSEEGFDKASPFAISKTLYGLVDSDWCLEELEAILSQLPVPFILAGDFNAHNPLWGSERLDRGVVCWNPC
nr:unnamed protein product [Callosobruchus analis]